ncbi:MAG: biotin-dependent carboxyltransferase family protein [Porticoccaceae bacterium]|nr:biotin-dependent carboxyltransferase family protein [Porticoccaceae bacterium]
MNGSGFYVIRPGMHSLIQDLGRQGCYRLGLTTGGPADKLSFLWANRLCGNRAHSAALEITFGGMEMEATDETRIAITGAQAPISIDGKPVDNWRSHHLGKGSRLTIGTASRGARIYLAVSGGFQIPPTLASVATVTREAIGGLKGTALNKGDFLPFIPTGKDRDFALPPQLRPTMDSAAPLRVIPGWRAADLPRALKRDFFYRSDDRLLSLSADSNRMGYRLSGEPLADIDRIPAAMLSEGIVAGTVQLPASGLPIIMHCDHQTIGGYPKIGTVISTDLWRLAQLPAGSRIRFTPITVANAQHIHRQTLRMFESTVPWIID